MHDLGDLIPITFEVRDASGALTDATTVTLTVTLPDGTTTSPTVTNPPAETGIYTYDYPTTQAGRHTWRVTTTGPTDSYGPVVVNVAPAGPGGIIGLDEAKKHLNMAPGDGSDDDELREMIDAATPVVEDVVGPVVARSFTEVHGAGSLLVLRRCPVISVSALVPVLTGGVSYLVADVDVDGETGIVRRLGGGSFAGPLRVTYTAGRRIVPGNIIEGTKIIVGHAWETQRGHSGARPGFGEEDLVPTPSGYLVPRRAMEWFRPHQKAPLVA